MCYCVFFWNPLQGFNTPHCFPRERGFFSINMDVSSFTLDDGENILDEEGLVGN